MNVLLNGVNFGESPCWHAAPPPLLRFVAAHVLVASTVVVLATGLELWLFGPR